MNRKDAENAEEKGRERFVPENSLVSMPGVQTQSGPRPRDLENNLVSMPGVQTQSGPRPRELENSLVRMPGVQTQPGPRPRDRESSLLSLPGGQTQSGPRLRPTILAALFLGALCISALSLPSEAQKRPAKAKAKPTPKRG